MHASHALQPCKPYPRRNTEPVVVLGSSEEPVDNEEGSSGYQPQDDEEEESSVTPRPVTAKSAFSDFVPRTSLARAVASTTASAATSAVTGAASTAVQLVQSLSSVLPDPQFDDYFQPPKLPVAVAKQHTATQHTQHNIRRNSLIFNVR